MSDKYAEAGSALISLFKKSPFPPTLEEVVAFLRSAFPPPAEDAKKVAKRIDRFVERYDIDEFDNIEDDFVTAIAAEIESFAQSRVNPWREALNWVTHLLCGQGKRGGAPESGEIEEATADARALLSDSTAKEAAK